MANPRNDEAILQQGEREDWQQQDEQRQREQEEHLRKWRAAWDAWGKTGITKETDSEEDSGS